MIYEALVITGGKKMLVMSILLTTGYSHVYSAGAACWLTTARDYYNELFENCLESLAKIVSCTFIEGFGTLKTKKKSKENKQRM